ncbi:PREDICTED: uncharacterized protein LOC104994206, partial [Bison bison bison]|uniref:Uncharacterized protein LOC104994206 n=1 Tax=Bison bison bison TaxID=43346 RepID=A0A6P3I502_BISBB
RSSVPLPLPQPQALTRRVLQAVASVSPRSRSTACPVDALVFSPAPRPRFCCPFVHLSFCSRTFHRDPYDHDSPALMQGRRSPPHAKLQFWHAWGSLSAPRVVICQEHSLKAQRLGAGRGDMASALPGSATPLASLLDDEVCPLPEPLLPQQRRLLSLYRAVLRGLVDTAPPREPPGPDWTSPHLPYLLSRVLQGQQLVDREGGRRAALTLAWVEEGRSPRLWPQGLAGTPLTGRSCVHSAREAGAGATGEPLLRPDPPRPGGPARQPHQPDRVPLPPQALLRGGPWREAGAGGRLWCLHHAWAADELPPVCGREAQGAPAPPPRHLLRQVGPCGQAGAEASSPLGEAVRVGPAPSQLHACVSPGPGEGFTPQVKKHAGCTSWGVGGLPLTPTPQEDKQQTVGGARAQSTPRPKAPGEAEVYCQNFAPSFKESEMNVIAADMWPDPRSSTDPQSTWDPGPGPPSTPWFLPGRPLPRGVGPLPVVQPSQPSATGHDYVRQRPGPRGLAVCSEPIQEVEIRYKQKDVIVHFSPGLVRRFKRGSSVHPSLHCYTDKDLFGLQRVGHMGLGDTRKAGLGTRRRQDSCCDG